MTDLKKNNFYLTDKTTKLTKIHLPPNQLVT